ncbi:MAG: ferritin [Proteobacteria bacterium]|jgi:ferritin|nr:ferritin [Pseudomonadota bacterium]NLN61891.1 ferritin [Myxococcales bacterium]
MVKQEIQDSINAQINAEIYSAYLYMSMSTWFENEGLPGFAHWMRLQAIEEMYHAARFSEHLVDRGGRVLLTAIEGPPQEWNSTLEAVEATLAHEEYVTDRINKMMDLAIKLSDHAAVQMLGWFVAEQVEEEASAGAIIDQLKLACEAKGALLMLDKELGSRPMPTPPPDVNL